MKGKVCAIFLQAVKSKTTQNLNSFVDRQHKWMERLHIVAASCHSINIADFIVSVENLYGIIKLQSREADSFMRPTVIVLTYSCYWWNRGNKMKILLFLCPQSKYDLNVANLMTEMKLWSCFCMLVGSIVGSIYSENRFY